MSPNRSLGKPYFINNILNFSATPQAILHAQQHLCCPFLVHISFPPAEFFSSTQRKILCSQEIYPNLRKPNFSFNNLDSCKKLHHMWINTLWISPKYDKNQKNILDQMIVVFWDKNNTDNCIQQIESTFLNFRLQKVDKCSFNSFDILSFVEGKTQQVGNWTTNLNSKSTSFDRIRWFVQLDSAWVQYIRFGVVSLRSSRPLREDRQTLKLFSTFFCSHAVLAHSGHGNFFPFLANSRDAFSLEWISVSVIERYPRDVCLFSLQAERLFLTFRARCHLLANTCVSSGWTS